MSQSKPLIETVFKKSEVVAKSNRLVEASYRLSINELRLIRYAISRAREEERGLHADRPVTITAAAFSAQFPTLDKSNVYRQLKEALESLYERSVTIQDIDDATGLVRIKKTRWISEGAYVDGAGNVQMIFTPEVIKYITRVGPEFTWYRLEEVANMTSIHAVRMYELLKQFEAAGKRTLNLAWLRDKLQIGPNEYKLTADFRKWVLDVAVKQIREHSSLDVKYVPQKTGRAITDFVFTIRPKKIKEPAGTVNDQRVREKLEANGQQRLLDEYDHAEEF